VDQDEFIHLYEMVLADEVSGLHLHPSKSDENAVAKLKVKKASFKEKLQEKRDDKQRAFWMAQADEHERQVQELFAQIDLDNSGGIDINELRAAAPILKITEAEAIDLFNNFEIDDNGFISLDEFREHYSFETMEDELKKFSSRAREAAKSEAQEVFAKIDLKKSGHILQEDFRKAAASLDISPDEADAIFYELDADGNGDIDMEEFYLRYASYKKKVAVIGKRKAEYKSGVEQGVMMNQQYRNTVSEELMSAKEQWQKRQKAEAMKKQLIQERIQARKKQDELDAQNREAMMQGGAKNVLNRNNANAKNAVDAAAKQKEAEKLRAERVKTMDIKTRDEQFEKDFQMKLKKSEDDRLKHIAGYKPKAWTSMFFTSSSKSEPSSPRNKSPSSPRSASGGWKLFGSSSGGGSGSGKKSKKSSSASQGRDNGGDDNESSSSAAGGKRDNDQAESGEKKRARIAEQRKKVEEIKAAKLIREAEQEKAEAEQTAQAKATAHEHEHHDHPTTPGKSGSFKNELASPDSANKKTSSSSSSFSTKEKASSSEDNAAASNASNASGSGDGESANTASNGGGDAAAAASASPTSPSSGKKAPPPKKMGKMLLNAHRKGDLEKAVTEMEGGGMDLDASSSNSNQGETQAKGISL
jgi:Ca2+-binding EF-hand superfamily protein